ncbi:MAG: glycosyltransferase [Anaerolineae bacterium]
MHTAMLSAAARDANPYIDLLCRGLAAEGIAVTLLDQPGDGALPAPAGAADLLHLHWLELWGKPAYTSLAQLSRWGAPGRGLRRWLEPALNSAAHTDHRRQRFLDQFFAALAEYRARGGRVLYTVHNLGQHEGEGAAVEAAALQRLLHEVDAVHVHSRALADEMRRRLSNAPTPVAVIPHVNYRAAYANTVSGTDARRALHLRAVDDSASPTFLFFGLLRPYKGLEELLPAFRRLSDSQATLLVAGRPRPNDFAARLAVQVSNDPRVRWHPQFVPNDDVQLWMNAADAVVLPYRQITTSGAAMLAWSFGKPIIAPALPAFTEPLADAPFLGLLYDPAAPNGLADALQQAATINWPSQRAAILAWVDQFSWQRTGQQMAALYRQVLKAA